MIGAFGLFGIERDRQSCTFDDVVSGFPRQRLHLNALPERKFYEDQQGTASGFLKALAIFIGFIMAVGAVFGTGAGNQTYIDSDGDAFKTAVNAYFAAPAALP